MLSAIDHTIHQNTNSNRAMDVIEFITAGKNVKKGTLEAGEEWTQEEVQQELKNIFFKNINYYLLFLKI